MLRQVYSKRQKKKVWGYDLTIHGRRLRDSGFATKQDAETAVAALRVRVQQEKYGLAPKQRKRIRLADLVEARVKQIGCALDSRRQNNRILRSFERAQPPGRWVDEVTTADLHEHFNRRLADGVRSQTAKQEVGRIHACLAAGSDLFPALADWSPPRTPRLPGPKSGQRERVITPDELDAIFRELRRTRPPDEMYHSYKSRLDIADIFQTALQTTSRRNEVLGLRWDDVNWNWKTVRIMTSKTSETSPVKTVPVPESLLEMFRRRRARQPAGCPWIFPGRTGKECRQRFDGGVLKSACKRAGVPYGRYTAGGIVFHDSRHTAVTAQLAAGADLPTVQANSGHSTRQMLLRYAHASARSRREAVQALDLFGVNLATGVGSDGSESGVQSETKAVAKRER